MKRLTVIGISIILVGIIGCGVSNSITQKKKERLREHFTVEGITVYYDKKPIAKYQAKTFSLDGGELVEEYNLLMSGDFGMNKQIIGDLIDFVSDRHQGAEVEVEVESYKSPFNL
jgi:hypothetical protein